MTNRGDEFSFFQGIHVKIDVRTEISISTTPIITKGASTRFDSIETYQAGTDDVPHQDHVTN